MTRLHSSFFWGGGVPGIDQNFEQPKTAGDTELFSAENIWLFNKIEKISLSQSWSRFILAFEHCKFRVVVNYIRVL